MVEEKETITKDKKSKKEKKEDEKIFLTKEEIEAMNKKASDAEERALRASAELINYRKRKDEEMEKKLIYANEDLILEILPILDNFERAIIVQNNNSQDATDKFSQGVKMIYASLIKTLEKYGVTEIKSLGELFDPKYHQAVMTDSVQDKPLEVITEVFQKGYMLKDKVIRPAMVKVNK